MAAARSAPITSDFSPSRRHPSPSAVAWVVGTAGTATSVGSYKANDRVAAPAMTSGRSCLRCASLPNWAMGIAEATMLLRYGTGATVRPTCSAIRQASRMP